MFAWTRLTETGNAASGPRRLVRVTLTAAGDAATAIVYDATSGTDNPVTKLAAAAGVTITQELDVMVSTGIRVALTGTTPVCCVVYQ